jgi:hypothetical protein
MNITVERIPVDLTLKVQLTAGIYAAKALVQHLCELFHDPKTCMFLSPAFRYSPHAILRSRGFDAYVPAVNSSECTFRVKEKRDLIERVA